MEEAGATIANGDYVATAVVVTAGAGGGGDVPMCLRPGGRVIALHGRRVPIPGVGSSVAFNRVSISSRESAPRKLFIWGRSWWSSWSKPLPESQICAERWGTRMEKECPYRYSCEIGGRVRRLVLSSLDIL